MSVEPRSAADENVPAADHSQTPTQPMPTTPGELLRVERERRGLTIRQAADELHLDTRLISAIESNNFLILGAPVYAKGHLRKYASLLGLSPDEVIAHYQTLTDIPAVPTVMPLSASPPRERVSLRVPGWIIAALVVGAVAWWLAAWLLDRRGSSEPDVAAAGNVAMPVAVGPAPATSVPAVTAPGTSGNDQTALELPTAQPPAAQLPAAAAQPEATVSTTSPAATNELTMQLRFASASWAEVHDASNKRLMYEIGQPGQTRSVSGRPPLTVNLGLASAVSMTVNSRPVAIPRRAGKDATKFVVAADGSVR